MWNTETQAARARQPMNPASGAAIATGAAVAWRASLRIAAAAALLAASALAAQAQFGVAVGYRSVGGEEPDNANFDRTGYEARFIYDRTLHPAFGWRAELTYTQMQFTRDDLTQRFQVSENGVELLAAFRAEIAEGTFSGLYASAGPVASFRAVCGSSGQFSSSGRVACDEGEKYRTGWYVGTGYRWFYSPNRDFFVEARLMGNTVASAGRTLGAVSFGIRARR